MASRKVRAQNKGTDEVNVSGISYPVDATGVIEVPAEAVDALVAVGGFTLEEDPQEKVEAGMSRARAPGVTGCSWEGVSYDADEDGIFVIPSLSLADLASHGFFIVADEPAIEPPAPAAPKLKIPS